MFAKFVPLSRSGFQVRALIALVLLAVFASGTVEAQDTRTVVEPTFPGTCTALAAQQAIAGGEPTSETSLDTGRIQAALTACPAGQAVELTLGGTNNVDNAFLTGPLNIPSGVTLIVDGGVTLFGSRNPADYQSSASGAETCGTVGSLGNGCIPLIQINGGNASSGSGVMGFGVINGRGGDKLLVNGAAQAYAWWDLANQANGNGAQNNPILLYAKNAANFTLYKITLVNSPMFHVKYQDASGFTVWGLKIVTPYSARNTDGIDPDDKISNVTINQSYISDGDDDVAIGASGVGKAVSNVTIENTHTYSGHGLSIGSYTSGGVSNVLMQNISMAGNLSDTNSGGLKIKSAADRGGLVNNVQYQNICIQNVRAPLQFNPFYNSSSGTSYPSYQNIGLHSVTVAATSGSAIQLEGYNANNPLGITFDNLNVTGSFTLSPNPQFADITLGPGPVSPASLQTISPTANGSVGVVYGGSITNPSQAAYPCPTAAFQPLAGELYLSTPTTNNQRTVSLPNPASFTLNAVVEGTEAANPAPASTIQFYEGTNLVGTAALASNGTLASVALAGVSSGVHTYTASYPKDSFYAAMPFGSVAVNVNTTGTTTSMTASPTSAAFGATVALTATVTPTVATVIPSGSVTFQSGSTVIGVAALNSQGVATLNAMTLPVGNDQVAAYYTGSNSFGVSDSSATPVNVSISKAVTVTVVGAAPATTTYGGNVILTADVTPATSGIPTGTVTFMDGATILGTAVAGPSLFPNYSEAQLTVSYLGAGNHTITAIYGGDNNYLGSTAAQGAPETVLKAPTTSAVVFSPASIAYGSSVTIVATVNTGLTTAATGTITFIDTTTSTTLGTVAILSGTNSASYSTQILTAGTHNIQVVYSGNVNYLGSTSTLTPLVVTKAASTTAVAATGTTITFGTNDTISVTVSPATTGVPSGSVTFLDGTTVIGTATLFGSKASISTATLSIATHSITVSYGGDSNFSASTSVPLLITVTVAPTTTVVNVPASITFGSSALLTASVSSTASGTLTGTITFKDGSTVLGNGTVSGGSASFIATGLGGGLHSITAVYSGDPNFGTSTSVVAMLTVNTEATATSVVATPSVTTFGTSITLAATVLPAGGVPAESGTVTFFDGGARIGSAIVTNEIASISLTTLPTGSHTVTATYGGDTNYAMSSSAGVSVVVNQAASAVVVTANPATITYGNSTVLTATISPSTGTGTVTFMNGSSVLGSGTVNASGVATFTTTTLAVGVYSVTAVYSGDANYLGSTSAATTLTVNQISQTITFPGLPSQVAYGVLPLTLGATASSNLAVTYSVSGPASISGSTLTITGSGTVVVTLAQAGNANYSAAPTVVQTLVVTKANLTVQASNATRVYGTANPALTGLVTGVVGNDAITATYSTTATVSSAVGNYAITPTVLDPNNRLSNYALTTVPGTLVVTGISTTTTLSVSAGSVYAGQSVTLTANVGSAAGAPATGAVTFLNGTATLGTGTVTNGVATLVLTNLPVGADSLTATFAASGNYAGSVSAVVTLTVVAPVTLSLNPPSLSLAAGASGTSTLTLTPVAGFTGSVAVACSSPVTYITCTVTTPVTITGTAPGTSTVTVTVAGTYGELRMPQGGPGRRASTIVLAAVLPFGALILLPLVRRRRQWLSPTDFRTLTLWLLAAGLSLVATGCAGSGSITPSLPPAGSRAVTITATANSATVTTTLTVNVTN